MKTAEAYRQQENFLTYLDLHAGNRDTSSLKKWLINNTDFFSAPASTKFHGAYYGGLCEHSLNVYNIAKKLYNVYDPEMLMPQLYDALCLAALLHDVCKIDCYKTTTRNVKKYINSTENVKRENIREDAGGKYVWDVEQGYAFDEKHKYGGHGSKSVFLVMQYFPLTFVEASAINCHMGAWADSKIAQCNCSPVYEVNSVAFLLHIADEWSTFVNFM